MIYFDNAATSGHKPQTVINAVNNALKNLSVNPGRGGYFLSKKAAEIVYTARKKTADFFGAKGAENVSFTYNCTTSINYVLKGTLSAGDHLVISDLEHNAVMRPIKSMNISYSVAHVSHYDDDETLENFKKALKPNTKMLFCTAASNVTGKILPLAAIGDLCKKEGILFGVDAAQAAGVIPIDMEKMNIDFLCIAPHKGLYCPMGIGILIAQAPIKKTIIEGGTGTESKNYIQPNTLPEMLESGTINLPAIAAVSSGIDFVKRHKNIAEFENNLVQRFYTSLKDDITFYTNPKISNFAPVICFNLLDLHSEETAKILDKNGFALRAGLHCAPAAHKILGTLERGAVRFSPSVFNNANEVDMLIRLIKNFKKSKKHY